MTSAFLNFAARPVGFTSDAASLRALPLDQVASGQVVQLTAAGGLQFWLMRWDPAETAADDGAQFIIPDSIVFPAPGRWVALGATGSVPNTYVLRNNLGLASIAIAAPLVLSDTTAAGNTTSNLLVLEHLVDPGSGLADLGASLSFRLENGGGAATQSALLASKWTNPLAGSESAKVELSTRVSGAEAVRLTVTGSDLQVNLGSLLVAAGSRVDTAAAGVLQIGGSATVLTPAPSTGQVSWQKGASLARTDLFDPSGANLQTYEPGATSVSEAWSQSTTGAGGKWSRSGQRGLAGNAGGQLAFVTGLGGTPGTDLAGSFDVDLGQTVSQATAQLRLLSNSVQFAGIRAISGQLLSIEASGGASAGGLSFSSPALIQHLLQDDQLVIWQWSTTRFTRWRRKLVQTVNNTADTTVSFSLPSSCSGTVEILVTAVDRSNGDRATYRRLYNFRRLSAGTSVFTAIGADVESEDDATWDAIVTHASPTITLRLTGDASNPTDFDAQWRIDYQTFTPAP